MSTQLDSAYHYIREKILNGSYRPSQKLTEAQLSEEIGVSRNTVIKALLKLEQENLVSIEKNKGATIKSFTLKEVLNYLEIREVLEGLAIRSAVRNIDEKRQQELKQILGQMNSHLNQHRFEEYSMLNKEFHTIIYSFSSNEQAVELINTIKTQLSRLHIRTIFLPGRNHDSYNEHKRIYEALCKRDEKEAESAIIHHVSNIRRTIELNYNYLQ